MRQVVLNQYEKVVEDDHNDLQQYAAKSLQDDFLYNYFGQPANGVLGSSFKASYVSALAASLAAGVGFYYDSSQVDPTPKNRMILSASAIAVTFGAADPSHDRIDVVCLAPNYVVTSTASRYIKQGGVGPVVLTTVNKFQSDSYTLQVVAGTPASSPVAPAVPSGYIPIAQARIVAATGMTGSGSLTDTRNVFTFSVSNLNHNYATGTDLQSQLDELDAVLSTTAVSVDPGSTPTVTINSTYKGKCLEVNSANGALAVTLPAAPGAGFKLFVQDTGASLESNPITFARNGSGNIQGVAADYVFRATGGRMGLWYDGSQWWKI